MLLGLSVGICVPYFTLQRVRGFPLHTLPVTPVDRWIDFDPSWIGAYLSLALLVPIAPLLATRREELVRYAKGLTLLCLPSLCGVPAVSGGGPAPGDRRRARAVPADRRATTARRTRFRRSTRAWRSSRCSSPTG